MVFPNSIYSSHSLGSNELIKQGAYMYTQPEDIFNLLKLDFKENKIQTYSPTKNELLILEAISLGHNKTQLIIDTHSDKLTTSEIIQILLSLEIEEVIKRVDGVYVVL
jgi:predicted Rossmann fold nucleotide-binding protein DprA/Smf involved in DNA uptake